MEKEASAGLGPCLFMPFSRVNSHWCYITPFHTEFLSSGHSCLVTSCTNFASTMQLTPQECSLDHLSASPKIHAKGGMGCIGEVLEGAAGETVYPSHSLATTRPIETLAK